MKFPTDSIIAKVVEVTGPNGTIVIADGPFGADITFTDIGGGVWHMQAEQPSPGTSEFTIHGADGFTNAVLTFLSQAGTSSAELAADIVRLTGTTEVALAAAQVLLDSPLVNIATLGGNVHIGSPSSTVTLGNPGDYHDAEPWTAPALLNGWANVGGVQAPVGYRRRGRAVDIRGVVSNAAAVQTVFTLPAAYRPAFNHIYPCTCSGSTVGEIAITAATGAVSIVQGFPAASSATALSGVVPLD